MARRSGSSPKKKPRQSQPAKEDFVDDENGGRSASNSLRRTSRGLIDLILAVVNDETPVDKLDPESLRNIQDRGLGTLFGGLTYYLKVYSGRAYQLAYGGVLGPNARQYFPESELLPDALVELAVLPADPHISTQHGAWRYVGIRQDGLVRVVWVGRRGSLMSQRFEL